MPQITGQHRRFTGNLARLYVAAIIDGGDGRGVRFVFRLGGYAATVASGINRPYSKLLCLARQQLRFEWLQLNPRNIRRIFGMKGRALGNPTPQTLVTQTIAFEPLPTSMWHAGCSFPQ